MMEKKILILIFFIFLTSCSIVAQTEFSQANAYQLLKYLSIDIGPRPMGSPAEQQALRFAVEKFREYGCDAAYIMPIDRYSEGNTSSGVAVGIKHGSTKRIIVIGGHIDSSDPEIPGANDDGSGSAVVMEAARVLGHRQHQSTIVFCCFGGEEKGLIGSQHFAANFAPIDSIVLMLQVDMANGLGILDIDPDAHGSLSAPRWLVRAAVEEFHKLGYEHLRYPTHFFSLNHSARQGPGSDHEPFLRRGVPSIAFISDVSYPVHTAQDNFENFDPAGLKRSGDVILKLVERFDGGIPERKLERYWLYLIGSMPIYIPVWGLSVFVLFTLIITVLTIIAIRKRRELPDAPNRRRWSGIKIFFFTLIVVTCGWFSSDIVGVLKGVRHPWLSDIGPYYFLAAIGTLIGVWISLRLSAKIRLSHCPYIYYKRSVIIFTVFLAVTGLLNVELTLEPAAALLLISLAMLVRQPFLKFLFLALSPWWMLRLIFSEWSEIIFHEMAKSDTTGLGVWLLINSAAVLLLSIYIMPFLLASAAMVRDSQVLKMLSIKLRSVYVFGFLMICFSGLTVYLITSPTFTNYWHKEIRITQEYDVIKTTKEISVESPEYLNDLRISQNGKDTLITSKVTSLKLEPTSNFDTTWLTINRTVAKHRYGDTTHYDLTLGLKTKFRPYTISLSYSIDGKELNAFDTPYQFRTNKTREKRIEWYSFPDSTLTVPVKFSVIGGDTVRERIEVTFNKLASPMKLGGEMMYLVPRTKYKGSYNYIR